MTSSGHLSRIQVRILPDAAMLCSIKCGELKHFYVVYGRYNSELAKCCKTKAIKNTATTVMSFFKQNFITHNNCEAIESDRRLNNATQTSQQNTVFYRL